jgi:hypothetical protein
MGAREMVYFLRNEKTLGSRNAVLSNQMVFQFPSKRITLPTGKLVNPLTLSLDFGSLSYKSSLLSNATTTIRGNSVS